MKTTYFITDNRIMRRLDPLDGDDAAADYARNAKGYRKVGETTEAGRIRSLGTTVSHFEALQAAVPLEEGNTYNLED